MTALELVMMLGCHFSVGDYIVAYSGYVQRLGAVEYDGKRLVVTKAGHAPEYEFYAYESDKFSIRKVKGKHHGN